MAESGSGKIILPEKYYHTYFCELLDFVKDHSGHLLDDPDFLFLDNYYSLTEDAQCLFIRLSNRKGPYFRTDKLHYEELADINSAMQLLEANAFISRDIGRDPLLLNKFTKSELVILFDELELKKLSKTSIDKVILDTEFHIRILETGNIVRVEKQDEVEFFKLLFFGQYKRQMTEFVIRDVGNIQLETLDHEKFTPWFEKREEALSVFQLSKLLGFIRYALQTLPASTIHDSIEKIEWEAYLGFDKSQKIGDRIFLMMGQELERESEPEKALFYFEKSRKHPARERRIRILDQLNRQEEATTIAEEILQDHWNATEKIFATDFLSRKKIRINRSTSAKLSDAKAIIVERNNNVKVEQLALEYYQRQGFEGIHAENYLWRNLFGLFFWDVLFDQSHDTFHHPLQRSSSDLRDNAFYIKRKLALIKRCKGISSSSEMMEDINQVISTKYGVANPFVYWHEGMELPLAKLIQFINKDALFAVLLEMAKNLKDNTAGFPDLFIWNEETYHFYEIKSPNDHLSSQQLFWLDFMQERGINTEIIKLSYKDQ